MLLLVGWFLSAVLPKFQIDTWGSAFLAAFLIGLCGAPLYFFWWEAVPGDLFMWQMNLLQLAINLVSVGIVSLVLPGMRLRSFVAWLIVGFVLTGLDVALRFVPFYQLGL